MSRNTGCDLVLAIGFLSDKVYLL